MVSAGVLQSDCYTGAIVDRDDLPYGDFLAEYQRIVQSASQLVGFNIKYDLHWLRRYGVLFQPGVRIWDCQLAHFLLESQSERYPSLNGALERYDLPRKLDIVEKDYWDAGKDTDEVPPEILLQYMEQDVRSTRDLSICQAEEIRAKGLERLMDLCCKDLLVLEEMEWNGLKMNVEYSLEQAQKQRERQREYAQKLVEITNCPQLNWSSPKQVSAILYGGTIDFPDVEEIGVYKTGPRAGQRKFKKVLRGQDFPQIVEPLEGTETATQGTYSTDEGTLRQLKATGIAKEIIDTFLKYKEIDKLVGTYYQGLPEKLNEYQWEDNVIHHSLNQCVARTGRLSSSNPNLQNIDRTTKGIFITRW